ncbi:MAG: PilZ domain-containing protein [Nitrospiraceae bacterium]|nr:MAG: PilZ domain-containing protein [Nitrospiraceae bacterium]
MIYSERRYFQRIPSNLYAFFYCGNTYYSGIIVNLSFRGVLISTKNICFPFDLHFELYIPLPDIILRIPVKVSRLMRLPDSFDWLGVEIQNPPKDFLIFVDSLSSQHQSDCESLII